MNRLFKSFLLVLLSMVMTFGANVISWVPPYFIDECLPTPTTGMLNQDFGGVKMADGLTHLALQFWNPNPNDGSIYYGRNGGVAATDSDVARFKQWGKNNNVKILLCVYNTDETMGAWNWNYVKPIIDNATLRTKFINNLVQEMIDQGLDGIEVDLENGKGGEGDAANFIKFISELSTKVKAEGKFLSIASFHYIWNMPNNTMWNSLFPLVDGVSSMGYEDIGASGSGYHAYSYQKAQAPDDAKLMLGMPTKAASWQESSVQTHVDWAKNNGVGVGVWDASLANGNGVVTDAWKKAGVWKSLKAIKDASGNGNGGNDDPQNPSSNMLDWAYWSSAKDELSTNNSATNPVSNGVAKGSFSLAAKNSGLQIYTWGNLTAELPEGASNNLSGVDYVKVTYKSNNTFKLVLPQAPLDDGGKSHFYSLPASPSSYTTKTIRISQFDQPDWAQSDPTPLNLSIISSLKFQLDGVEGQPSSGYIEVKDLVIYNYSGEETGSGATYHTVTGNAGNGGSISPSGAQSVKEGENQVFNISASNGYEILDVKVDGVSKGAKSSITVPNVSKNVVVSATFKATSGGGIVTPTGKPYSVNGALSVDGRYLVNSKGIPIQLRGMSTHGLQYYEGMYSGKAKAEAICKALANDWKADVIRLSNYVNEGNWGNRYTDNPDKWHNIIDNLVDAAANNGIYAIIDWHMLYPGDPNDWVYNQPGKGAAEFWKYMAAKHGGKDHVIFEVCNEPNDHDVNGQSQNDPTTWAEIKSYADKMIKIIRDNEPDNKPNVVIVGTSTWCQDPHSVLADLYDPAVTPNIMYTLHFYAATHTQSYPDDYAWKNLKYAISKNVPVFVTEFGTQDASGGGTDNFTSSDRWLDLLKENNISWVNWNFSNDHRSGAVFNYEPTTDAMYSAPYNLKASGTYIIERMRRPDSWDTQITYPETSNMLSWATWEAKIDERGSTIDTGSALVINEKAKATFSLIQNDAPNYKYSWGLAYASLPKGDNNNLKDVKQIKVRYRSTVPIRVSIPMKAPLDQNGEAYCYTMPASPTYTTKTLVVEYFAQPSWAATSDPSLDHPLDLSEVTSIVFNVDGDDDAVVNGYIEIDSLTLFNYQGEETGLEPVLSEKITEIEKIEDKGNTTVKDTTLDYNADGDTLVTTTVTNHFITHTINQIDSLKDDVVFKTTFDTLTSVEGSTVIETKEDILKKVPVLSEEKSTSVEREVTSEETTRDTTLNYNDNGDTLVVVKVTEFFKDHTVEKTDSLKDGTVFKTTLDTLSSVEGSELLSEDEIILYKKVAILEVDGEGKSGITEPVFAPNPVYRGEEGTVFRIPSDLKGDWNIEIRDAVGNLIDKATINSFGGAAYKWDLRNRNGSIVTNGMYVAIIRYKAKDGSTKVYKKMIGVRE